MAQVWACLLSAQAISDAVPAVFDTKVEKDERGPLSSQAAFRLRQRPSPSSTPPRLDFYRGLGCRTQEAAQAYWERREGCKMPDLSKGMCDAPDMEHGVEIRGG